MHALPRLLVDLGMVLGVAGLTGLLFHRFRLPVVLGYVLAGLFVGPYVPLPLVADKGNVQTLADLGVILLMFSIGLEFSIQRLFRAGPTALLMGSIQVGFAILLGGLVSRLLGWSRPESLFVGAALAISSTMVVVKLFEEYPQVKEVREAVFSVLVVQDLFAILLLTSLTTYARLGGLDASELSLTIVKLSFFLLLVLGLGRLVIPRFIRWVADHARAESLLVSSVGLCFVCSLGAAYAGFPLALGAFLGGMLASESGRVRKIERLVAPLKDLFTAIFFVAVGMMLDPRALPSMGGPILLFSLLVILGNALSITSSGLLAGLELRTSLRSALALGQIGEFGYIILGTGIAAGIIRQELYTVAIAVGVVTAFASPFLLKASPFLAQSIENSLPNRFLATMELYRSWADSLRKRGIRHGETRWMRRPVLFLMINAALLLALVPAFDNIIAFGLPYLEQQLHWTHRFAELAAAALLGILAALLVFSMLRQEKILARDLAVLAPSSVSGGVARRGRHLLAGGLRIALLLMIGLPLLAVIQSFTDDAIFLAVALGVFLFSVFIQLHLAKRLAMTSPGGAQWLEAQVQQGSPALPRRKSLLRRVRPREKSS